MNYQPQPNDIESEIACLAACLINRSALDFLIKILTPETFYDKRNSLIFQTMIDLHEKNIPIDELIIKSELKKMGNLEKVGGVEYLINLSVGLPSAFNIKIYANNILENYKLRLLIDVCNVTLEKAYNQKLEFNSLLEETDSKLFDLHDKNKQKDHVIPINRAISETLLAINKRISEKGVYLGVESGFKELDRLTSGFQKGELIIIAARPSIGKTAFAVNVALHAAFHQKKVAIFSLEMSAESLILRILSSESQINSKKIQFGNLTDSEFGSIFSISEKLSNTQIFISDKSEISVSEIKSRCRTLIRKYGLDLIIIDYLQLIKPPLVNRNSNRTNDMSEISRALKIMARELESPVICLSQLNREIEKRANRRPQLSDLRDSGAIEQDADSVLFIHRQDFYSEGDDIIRKNDVEAEFFLRKNRNGPTGEFLLSFHKDHTRFYNIGNDKPFNSD